MVSRVGETPAQPSVARAVAQLLQQIAHGVIAAPGEGHMPQRAAGPRRAPQRDDQRRIGIAVILGAHGLAVVVDRFRANCAKCAINLEYDEGFEEPDRPDLRFVRRIGKFGVAVVDPVDDVARIVDERGAARRRCPS